MTVQLELAEEDRLAIKAWRFSTTRAFVQPSQFLETLARMLTVQIIAVLFLGCYLYADQAQYLYDDQGRLAGVADSAGALAVYNYDSVGNLLSIDRFTPPGAGIGIYLVNPISGPVTQLCRLQGYGFDRWSDRAKEAGSLG